MTSAWPSRAWPTGTPLSGISTVRIDNQAAMEALTRLCRERFEAFGTAGNAARIRPIPLDEMAKRYASGALAPATATSKAA